MDPIQFVDDTAQTALNDVITDYQNITGRTLGNADPEMLLINAFAYRLALARNQINYTGNQNLISFATGAALDQLGMKSGTFRLAASASEVTITFNIAPGAPTLTIPAGTRVKSQDGAVLFETIAITNVPHGTGTIDIDCICTVTGVIGNGYTVGLIITIVDPVAYVTGASNSNTSTGGSDAETDDQLRARIPLANATYSVAGPTDAYIYFAKTADPSIVEVSVPDPVPVAGAIQTSSISAICALYAVNDTVTVDTGTTLAVIQILTVNVGGGVLTYKFLSKGAGYLVAACRTTTVTGAGAGFAINVLTLVSLMTINIYPLLAGGVIPGAPILNAVQAICSDLKVRPLSDTVVAVAPTKTNYSLTVNLTVKKSYDAVAIQAQVLANLNGFVNNWSNALGVDLKVNQFVGQCMVPGVYDVAIPSFLVDVLLDDTQFGFCTAVTVAVTSIVDEP